MTLVTFLALVFVFVVPLLTKDGRTGLGILAIVVALLIFAVAQLITESYSILKYYVYKSKKYFTRKKYNPSVGVH